MTQLNITDLRTHLRKAIEQVRAGEDIEIVQNGVVVAALVSPERLRPRIVTPNTRRAEALIKEMQAHRQMILANPEEPLGTLSAESVTGLLEELSRHREAD